MEARKIAKAKKVKKAAKKLELLAAGQEDEDEVQEPRRDDSVSSFPSACYR